MESSRLSARLAAYLDAIHAAREAGVTWTQLGAVFGTSGKYMAEAAKVAASGKYLAKEQLPLPSIQATIQATKAEPEPRSEQPRRATGLVKTVGQDNHKPISGGAAIDWEALARKNKGDEAEIQWKG